MVEHAGTQSLLVAVFDGHGVHGHDVSGFVARAFVQALLQDDRFVTLPASKGESPDLCAALADALQVAEVQLIRGKFNVDDEAAHFADDAKIPCLLCSLLLYNSADSGIDCSLSGSTAVASVIRGRTLWAICVGDSRLIATLRSPSGDKLCIAQSITTDHKPDMEVERRRIL